MVWCSKPSCVAHLQSSVAALPKRSRNFRKFRKIFLTLKKFFAGTINFCRAEKCSGGFSQFFCWQDWEEIKKCEIEEKIDPFDPDSVSGSKSDITLIGQCGAEIFAQLAKKVWDIMWNHICSIGRTTFIYSHFNPFLSSEKWSAVNSPLRSLTKMLIQYILGNYLIYEDNSD